jgi:hypothetical protein
MGRPYIKFARYEKPGSYFLELRVLGLKYLNSLMRIQDPGMEKSLIWDPGW